MIMIAMKKVYAFLIFALIAATAVKAQAPAQQDVSDDELKQFASVYKQIQSINQEVQQDMFEAIQEQGIDIQRFNELFQASMVPGQEIAASEEEMEKFNAAKAGIEKIQAQTEKKMEEVIVEEGLTLERYQEIAMAIQSSPDLQRKIQEYL